MTCARLARWWPLFSLRSRSVSLLRCTRKRPRRRHAPDHAGRADRGRRRHGHHRPASLAERLQERLKQPVVVENRVGARRRGRVSITSPRRRPTAARSCSSDISAVLHKWLHKSVPFDVVEDFAPIAQVGHHAAPAVRASFAAGRGREGADRATPGPIPASSRSERRASARRTISPPPCSTVPPRSISPTCPIAARRPRSTISSAGRSR